MPSQQVEIAEAIAGIKRALKREREAPSDQPVVAASNRGNKLQQGAKFVHEGSLIHVSGPEVYKQKVGHAGYTRYILDRNPRRYNEYGEELEDSETDEEADADAADQNAYSGIRLEELLCPLKHPSELPLHPTMSPAYLSSALPDMVSSTHEKLRQERANLWRAKYLNRQLTGDASWIPAGEVESPEDWELFEPRNQGGHRQPSRKRKRQTDEIPGQNGNLDQPSETQTERNGVGEDIVKLKQDSLSAQTNGADGGDDVQNDNGAMTEGLAANGDAIEGKEAASAKKDGATESTDVSFRDAVMDGTIDVLRRPELNGLDPIPIDQNGTDEAVENQARPPGRENETDIHLESKAEADEHVADQVSDPALDEMEGSPPPPPRRITRALAANNPNSTSHSIAPTPPLSPASSTSTITTSSTSQLCINPLYLVPPSANPSNPTTTSTYHGLPPSEGLETRRLLTMYIQKQEESVRGYEAILSRLLTAQRLRTEVLEMCKTEEHVGELSDGEDWIDSERWGLKDGELRKGRDEDEEGLVEGGGSIGGRKGKRRGRG